MTGSTGKYSIGTQMAWLTLAPLLVMVLLLEAYFLHGRFVAMDNNLLTRGQLIAHQLAASSEYGVFSDNRAFLDGLANSVLHETDMKGAVILNAASDVLAVAGRVPAISSLASGTLGTAPKNPKGEAKLFSWVSHQTQILDRGNIVLVYQPILSTPVALDETETGQPAARQVGAVVIALSRARLERQESGLLWFTLLATAILLLVVWYLLSLASRRIVEPISELSKAIKAIGTGNLDTRVQASSHIAELSTLAAGVNRMAAELQHERSSLQHRIDEATEQLRNLAFYDTLTGLPNRRLLNDRLTQALAACRRSGQYGALMFLDLDNFKTINDRFGHAMGDQLLVEVARRISGCLREMDTVARFGGDEFVVMLKELDTSFDESRKQARVVAGKICLFLENPFALDTSSGRLEYQCSSSIGVVLFPQRELGEEDIMRMADTAMYQAKQAGPSRIYFHGDPTPERCDT